MIDENGHLADNATLNKHREAPSEARAFSRIRHTHSLPPSPQHSHSERSPCSLSAPLYEL